MPRSRPHSFVEWVIGANVAPRSTTTSQRRIATLDWTTDDDTGDDTVHLTLPRGKPTKGDKRVRFTEQVAREKPRNHTAKVSHTFWYLCREYHQIGGTPIEMPLGRGVCCGSKQLTKGNQTNPSGNIEASEAKSTTKDDSAVEDIDSDCPCGPCISGRKKLEEEIQAAKTNSEPSDAEIHAKHKAKKSKAKAKPDGKGIGQTKSQSKKVEHASHTTEKTVQTSEDKGKQESKSRKKKAKGANKKQPESAEETSSSEDTEDEPPKAQSEKKNKKPAVSTKSTASEHLKENKDAGIDKKEKRGKRGAATPSLPPRQPALLMPVQARVLQVEHSIEGAEDPRPNAFYDSEHGVMRVYHGPAYGNVYGALYPKRVPGSLAVGTPHPTQNPYLYGFAPPGFPILPGTPGAAAPEGAGRPHQNPWFQGWGTTTAPGVHPQTPANPRDAYNESPSLRINAKKDSNIVPFQAASINGGPSRKSDSSKPADVQDDRRFSEKEQPSGDKDGANDNNPLVKPYSPTDSNKIEETLERMRVSKNGSKSGSKTNSPQVANNANQTAGDGWYNQYTNGSANNKSQSSGSKRDPQQQTPSQGSPSQKAPSAAGNVVPSGEGDPTVNQGSPSVKPPSTAGNIGPSDSGGGGNTAAENNDSRDPNSNQRHHRRTASNEICPPGAWPPPNKQKDPTYGNIVGCNDSHADTNEDGKQNDNPGAAPTDSTTWANDNTWADNTLANTTGGFWDTKAGQEDASRNHPNQWSEGEQGSSNM